MSPQETNEESKVGAGQCYVSHRMVSMVLDRFFGHASPH